MHDMQILYIDFAVLIDFAVAKLEIRNGNWKKSYVSKKF